MGWIILSAAVLALGDGLVKLLSDTVSVWQLLLLRSLVAVPLLLGLAMFRHMRCGPRQVGWVALRSALLVTMWITVYLALTRLSLPSVSAALYSAPVWITLLTALAPGRRLTGREVAAVALGFTGVWVLLRPGTSAFSPMLLLPLAGAVCYALAALLTASRCCRESPLVLALGLHIMFVLVGAVGLWITIAWPLPQAWRAGVPFLATGWRPVPGSEWGTTLSLMAALALIAVVASIAMARAYQIGPAPLVAAGDYSYLLFSTLWSLLLFSRVPDAMAVAGMALIALAGIGAISPIGGTGRAAGRNDRPARGGPTSGGR